VSQNPQVQALKTGVDILVATPGRLLDLLGQRLVDLRRVLYFVLDEADRMLDMGFLRDVERILNMLPEKKQTMLFSATMPSEIERLTRRLLKNPV
jgi:ATP-dependent RNA helicase RhlE